MGVKADLNFFVNLYSLLFEKDLNPLKLEDIYCLGYPIFKE